MAYYQSCFKTFHCVLFSIQILGTDLEQNSNLELTSKQTAEYSAICCNYQRTYGNNFITIGKYLELTVTLTAKQLELTAALTAKYLELTVTLTAKYLELTVTLTTKYLELTAALTAKYLELTAALTTK